MTAPRLLAFLFAFTSLLTLPARAFEPSGMLEIHYINPTIQAGVTLVIGPDGPTVLMDAGKAGDLIPDYLSGIGLVAGLDDLDYTIAGHLDADHIRGFKDIFPVTGAGYDVPAAGANYFNGSDKTNTTITTYKNAAANTSAGAPAAVPLDTVIPLGDGATLTVVAVHGNITGGGEVSVPNENDRSVAVLIQHGDFDYLWASDLGGGDDPDCTDRDGVSSADVETPLAQAITPGGDAPMLPSSGVEVLHVNHHGSEASTNCHWMSLLNPDVALISVGPNSQGNPEPVVVDDILRAGASCACLTGVPPALVLQTDEGDTATGSTTGYVAGDILIMSDGVSYGIDATGARASGSPDERAAAGIPTVILVDEQAPGCPMEQILPSTVVTTTEAWKAKHRVLSTGSFIVGAGGAVTLEAGTRVILGDGFSVSSGGSLEVVIKPLTDCS